MRELPIAILACIGVAAPTAAFGWAGREHRAIGTESYLAACQRLVPMKSRDPETATRFQTAGGAPAF